MRISLTPWRKGLAVSAVLLPFLFGITLGPAPNMLPLLFGLGCAGLLLLCSPSGALRTGSHGALLALPVLLLLHGLVVAPANWPLLGGTLLALLMFWAVARAAAGWQQQSLMHGLWWGVFLAAALNSLICLLQYQGWISSGLSPWLHPGNSQRVFGNLRQPNQMASLSAIGFALLALYAPRYACANQGATAWRVGKILLALALLALLAFACAATRSRTGLLQWLGVWAALLFWCWRGRSNGKGPMYWATAGLLLYGLCAWALAQDAAVPGAAVQLQGSAWARLEDAGQDVRAVLWRNMLQVAAQQPSLGWGWGNLGWGLLNTPVQGEIFSVSVDNAHNLPLHLAVELGWPLALLFCVLLLAWVLRRQPWRAAQPEQQAAWLMLAVLGLHSLLEYPLWYAPFLLTAALAVGVLAAQTQGLDRGAVQAQSRWPLILGLGALALSLMFAWDWVRTVQVYLQPQQRSDIFTAQADWVEANSRSRWFAPYAEFALMGITPLEPDNAAEELARAQRLLHYSTEARVLRRAQEAAALLGDADLAAHYEQLSRRRWPQLEKPGAAE